MEEKKEEFQLWDLVWAKVRGHPRWPGIVVGIIDCTGDKKPLPYRVAFIGDKTTASLQTKDMELYKGINLIPVNEKKKKVRAALVYAEKLFNKQMTLSDYILYHIATYSSEGDASVLQDCVVNFRVNSLIAYINRQLNVLVTENRYALIPLLINKVITLHSSEDIVHKIKSNEELRTKVRNDITSVKAYTKGESMPKLDIVKLHTECDKLLSILKE